MVSINYIHMLLWLAGAPQFQANEQLTPYIDKIITSHKPADDPELLNLVNRQIQTFTYMLQE